MIGIKTIDGDLLVSNGLTLGDIRQEVAERVLFANQGEYKEHPILGCQVEALLGGMADPFWINDSKAALRKCGIDANNILIDPNGIIIE